MQHSPITLSIDCTQLTTGPEIHEYIAETLRFPQHYGANLDALVDCIGDVLLEHPISLEWVDTKKSLKNKTVQRIKKTIEDCTKN